MKFTGFMRVLDDLGRVVIPRQVREQLGLGRDSQLDIYTLPGALVLRKKDVSECPAENACGCDEIAGGIAHMMTVANISGLIAQDDCLGSKQFHITGQCGDHNGAELCVQFAGQSFVISVLSDNVEGGCSE